MYDCVINNIKLLGPTSWEPSCIAISEGKIAAIGSICEATMESIDGKGMLCLPGGVDLHVHFNEPGRTHWEGFATGSLSAAAGGCTYVAEMPLNSIPSTTTVDALKYKIESIGSKSYVDFSLWGGLVPGNADELEALAEAGVVAFKAFMSPSGTDDFINSDVATLREGMKRIAGTGKLLALHAEDPAVLKPAEDRLASKTSAFDWEKSRPVEAEISAIRIAIDLAGETGCPLHIVHVSAPEALEVIADARKQGANISCETCPHYLLLSIDQAHEIGPAAKCAPPLRTPDTVSGLWESLRAGMIDTIGSDHSPCTPDLKEGKSFYDAWGGISGLQHGLPLLWSQCGSDLDTYRKLIQLSCGTPANRVGLHSKGAIEVGKDADLVLVEELGTPRSIKESELLYKNVQSAYCEMKLGHSVSETWLRGEPIIKNGKAFSPPKGVYLPIT